MSEKLLSIKNEDFHLQKRKGLSTVRRHIVVWLKMNFNKSEYLSLSQAMENIITNNKFPQTRPNYVSENDTVVISENKKLILCEFSIILISFLFSFIRQSFV